MARQPDHVTTMEALRTTSAIPWSGTVYRQCTPKYATNADLLRGDGSRLYGGRWSPVGVRAVYASLSPEAAMAEALQSFRYYGWDIANAMPRVFVSVECSFRAVLDLTDGSIRQRLGLSLQRMVDEDWRQMNHSNRRAVTQRVGASALEAGLEGILVPSAAEATGRNLVWFPDNLQSRSIIAIKNAGQLP